METSLSKHARERIVAIDIARGYPMFLLIACVPLLRGLGPFSDYHAVRFVQEQLSHSAWHGVTYIDCGLPGFILTMGVTMSFALRARLESGKSPGQLLPKILSRSVVLFGMGIIFNGGFTDPWPDIRLAGVLQRIAICYLFGSIVICFFRAWGQLAVAAALLLIYWAILEYLPLPGSPADRFTFEGNAVAYVDRLWLPGRKYYGDWDSEGILSTIPAVATVLIGTTMGELLRSTRLGGVEKLLAILLVASACLSIGLIWSEWLPLNKPMWTPSFVLVASGVGFYHLAVYYLICDLGKKKWLFPLLAFGMNSLVAYWLNELIPFESIARRFVGGNIEQFLGTFGPMLVSIVQIGLVWLLLYGLYRRNIVMKV